MVFFDQCACGQDGSFVHFFERHAVVEIAQGFLHDRFGLDVVAQADAGRLDQAAQPVQVQHDAPFTIDHMQHRSARCLGFGLACALLRATLAVQHIGAGHLVVFAAHQAQLDLVLHILNVEGAAARA